MKQTTIQRGQEAEQQAYTFLLAKNFSLIEKNYRCYHGEIDLIMRDKDDIVFVEVRSRCPSPYASALESVNKTKMKKLIKTALHFLQKKHLLYKVTSRFDIVAIDIKVDGANIEWLKNAFEVDELP